MKHNFSTLGCLGLVTAALSSSAFADRANEAMAHVYVDVDPNVSVMALTGNLGMGSVQTGQFGGNVVFRVDANEEAVLLGVATTHLYKGDDPTNTDVKPLPVDSSVGALIEPGNANPKRGASAMAQYTSEVSVETPYGTMQGLRTNDIEFESSQNGHFSQDVSVSVGWMQPDPEQTKGEYSGYVVLYTALVGSTN
jgi:hypothetical protein